MVERQYTVHPEWIAEYLCANEVHRQNVLLFVVLIANYHVKQIDL